MKNNNYIRLVCIGISIIVFILARQAGATPGGSMNSVTLDRKALTAVNRATTTHSNYTIQEIESDSTTVREYVSLSGVVFAIVRNGRVHPNLATHLGSYADKYLTALLKSSRISGEWNKLGAGLVKLAGPTLA
jgi:hypothetical protein